MQSCIIVVGLVLMGQVGGVGGPRYGTPPSDSQVDNQAAPSPWDNPPPVTPREQESSQPSGQALFETQPQQPADSVSPQAPARTITAIKPSELLQRLMTPPQSGRLVGTPLTLSEAVSGSRSREEQSRRVDAYWNLSLFITDYYLAVREVAEFEALRQNVSQPGALWDEARSALTTRIQLARRSAEATQYHLQGLLGRTAADVLPLPSDSPHCGAYETRYEQNFAGRQSAEAEQLNELMPEMHQSLLDKTAAMVSDQQWLQAVDQQRNPESDGTLLLKTYQLVSLRRRAFINAINLYNKTIARYSELASPGEVGADRLVAMLIGKRPSDNDPRQDSAFTRTSAEEPLDSQEEPQSPPKTFVEEKRPVTRRKPAPEDGVERSILIKPDAGEVR